MKTRMLNIAYLAAFGATAAIFEEISKFSGEICDRIKTSGSIERTQIKKPIGSQKTNRVRSCMVHY